MSKIRISLLRTAMATLAAVMLSSTCYALRLELWDEETLRVACFANLAPYQFEEDGQLKGIHVEVMEAVAEKCGLELEWITYPSLSQCVEAVRSDQADVILGTSLDRTAVGDSSLIYSSEISSSYICMVAREDLVDQILDSSSYFGAAVYEYESLPYSASLQYRNVRNFIGVGSQDRVFNELIRGTADIAFGVRTCLMYNLEKAGLIDEYPVIYNYVQPVHYCLAVDAKNEQLLEYLNEAITSVRSSRQYDQIFSRWTPELDYGFTLEDWLEEHTPQIVLTVLTILFIFGTVMIMNYLLRVTVKKRTAELERANDHLRENAARSQYESALLRQVIESNPNGILLFDEAGTIELANRNAEHLLSRSELVGLNVIDFWLMRQILGNWKISDFEQETTSERREIEISLEDRIYFFQYAMCTLIKPGNTQSQARTVFILFEDITMKKIQEKQALSFEKSQLMNQLVAGIAHEIRNPLASLKALAQAAQGNADDPDYVRAFEELVPNEVDRIERLVSDLISYSKEPKTTLNGTEINVEKLVRSCLTLMKALIEKNQIVIRTSVVPDLTLWAEEDHIRQVILNILINSIDAVQQKRRSGKTVLTPHIWIRGRQSNGGVIIEIWDRGCGMSPGAIQKAARPFYSTKTNGTGLGLAISSRYVSENGGLLTIHSVEGEYTSVQISFPFEARRREAHSK